MLLPRVIFHRRNGHSSMVDGRRTSLADPRDSGRGQTNNKKLPPPPNPPAFLGFAQRCVVNTSMPSFLAVICYVMLVDYSALMETLPNA